MPAVRLPADVELADRLAFGLTARQLVTLAATAICSFGAEQVVATVLPLPLALAAATAICAAGIALALARHGGLAGGQLAFALGRHLIAPRQLVLAPDGLPQPLSAADGPRFAALEPPVARVETQGLVQLADHSHCLVLAASGTSFALRSADEQAGFVAAFGRMLNGLTESLQITVRREAVSLDGHLAALEQGSLARGPKLAAAAAAHADYLRSLGAHGRPLVRRRILLVFRTPERDRLQAEAALTRSAAHASEILRGAGVALEPLDGNAVAALLGEVLGLPRAPAGSHREGVIGARG